MRTPPARRRPSAQVSGANVHAVALVAKPGEEVNDESRSSQWEVVSVREVAGSNGSTAELFRKLDVAGRMKNRTVSELAPQKVEIWTLNAAGERDQPLFWGEMDTRSMRLSPNGEGETATATVRDYHFGEPLRGMQCWWANDEKTRTIEHHAEFNPLVDGRVIDNMMRQQDVDGFPDYTLWFLPESTRTETAYEHHGTLVSPSPWDIRYIVKTLQGWLNTDETYVTNYTTSDEDFADAPEVKNVTLNRGKYLPQLLDALLPPFGYHWHLAHTKETTGRIKPRIAVYQRGKGTKKKLSVPKLNDFATLKHNADAISLDVDVGGCANQVRCDGGVKEYQVSLVLYRAWSEDDDDADIADMTKNDSGASGALAHTTVWRKFVANEGGDYTNTRSDIPGATNLDSVFGAGNWIIRRRSMGNCLTWEDDEHTRRFPVRIEWSDTGPSGFTPIDPSWGARVLNDEIGIMFTGNSPPEELVAAGANAYIRITGTIQGDQRLTYTAERLEDHPNPNTAEAVLDVSDQFHYRQVVEAPAGHYSTVTGDADEADDTAALEAFAESVRDQKEPLLLQASVGLFGIQLEYQIGDILTEIDGRQIKLNRLPAARGERYLQVVGREWDFPGQRTTLHVAPYDR